MISCNKYFITIILFSLFSSTLVTACGKDGEGSSNRVIYPNLGKNDCFETMQKLTEKPIPEVEDMAKVAIRDWTSNCHQIANNLDLRSYFMEMDTMMDFDSIQSPSEWCGKNAIRLREEFFGSDTVEETQLTPKDDPKPSSSGFFSRILRKKKKKEEEPYLNDTERAELIIAKMKADAAKLDPIDCCLRRLTKFGETRERALKYAFNEITLNDVSHSEDWDVNFRYNYMEYLMDNVKFRSGVKSPHDYCYRDVYYSMDPNDERKQQYLNRRKKSRH